jgi:hypothetical protein
MPFKEQVSYKVTLYCYSSYCYCISVVSPGTVFMISIINNCTTFHYFIGPSLIMKRNAAVEQENSDLAVKDLEDGCAKVSPVQSEEMTNHPLIFAPADQVRVGCIGRSWEWTRDTCYIIQDTKTFQHTTTAMILLNAITLAITW